MRKKSSEDFKKYHYLIWKSEVGFMHLDRFLIEDIHYFIESLKKELSLRRDIECLEEIEEPANNSE